MSRRDDLRGTLSNTICNAMNYPSRAVAHILGGDMSVILDKTTDSLIAAGYRKPRTITTVEELDALPVGSVVLDSTNATRTYVASADGERYYADCYGEDGVLELPATVLHEPTA